MKYQDSTLLLFLPEFLHFQGHYATKLNMVVYISAYVFVCFASKHTAGITAVLTAELLKKD